MTDWWWTILFCVLLCGATAYYCFYNDKTDFELKCIVSDVNGKKYCVRNREPEMEHKTADLLATVCQNLTYFVNTYLAEKHPNNPNVSRLRKNFRADKISETLPNSIHTAYTEDKGVDTKLCLTIDKEDSKRIIDFHTLTFVALHELAHQMTEETGHPPAFWNNFVFLLQNAKSAGVHKPIDYSKQPRKYCGLPITNNPYFSQQQKQKQKQN